jgi:DNA-binding XRE family transcriptional regulator
MPPELCDTEAMAEATPLREALRLRVREIRRAKGWPTQEEFALWAQSQGVGWSRDTVKNIEDGARDVPLEEFFSLLPLLGVTLEELFPADVELEVAGGWRVKGGAGLRRLLEGSRDATVSPATVQLRGAAGAASSASGSLTIHPPRLADQKAAASLRVSVTKVQKLAQQTWGHDLTTEREARISKRVGGQDVPLRSLQALRGHVTRELLDELRPLLKKSRKPRRKGRG